LGEFEGPSSTGSIYSLTTPRVRVPRHVARLVTRLVAPLIVDYFASRSLFVDYFAYAVRPGASARHAPRRRLLRLRRASRLVVDYFDYVARPAASARRVARCVACRVAHRRLLHLRHTSGCLGTSRGSSSTTPSRVGSSSTTLPTPRVWVPRHITRLILWLVAPLVVDYFDYAARPGASARRVARRAARRRLLCLAQACR
jgi:hypothetical protein